MSTTDWTFDSAHTSVDFRIRHAVISWVRGSFRQWTGTLDFDPQHPEAVGIQFSVDVSSVDTGLKDRDEHLRSADFFDVAAYPQMIFVSTGVVSIGDGRYTLTGDLTLHGVTKQVSFDVTYAGIATDPWGATRAGFEAKTVLDRRDFGLVWNQTMETAGLLVGDTVEVVIEAEAVQA